MPPSLKEGLIWELYEAAYVIWLQDRWELHLTSYCHKTPFLLVCWWVKFHNCGSVFLMCLQKVKWLYSGSGWAECRSSPHALLPTPFPLSCSFAFILLLLFSWTMRFVHTICVCNDFSWQKPGQVEGCEYCCLWPF